MTPTKNWLAEWDIETVPCLYQSGDEPKESDFAFLLASDTKQPIGKPFNPSTYKPISNKRFLSLIDEVPFRP